MGRLLKKSIDKSYQKRYLRYSFIVNYLSSHTGGFSDDERIQQFNIGNG